MKLSADNVSYRYPGAVADALRDVSVTLEPGAVTAILGPNGAGKSTLFRVLAGLAQPTAGQVTVDGRELAQLAGAERARAIAIAAQDPARPRAWTALEVVLMGRAPHLRGRQLESDADVALARQALAAFGASALADRSFGRLSGGEQQRVLLARAVCQDTPVVLFDEPSSHLDPRHALQVGAVCRDLAARGRAVGCVLHDVNLAAQLADVVVLLREGRVAAHGDVDAVLQPSVLQEVYGIPAVRLTHGGRAVIAFLDAGGAG